MVRRAALLMAVALAASACGGSSGSGGGGGKGGTLTLIMPSPPASLDPAKGNVGSDNWALNLAYDTLIRWGKDGRLEPDLATSWGYVGKGNKVFELTLREGVKFADGTPLDAKAVVASLDYARKKGLNVAWVSAVESVSATGLLKVRILCKTPHPALPQLLTQVQLIGSVISPKGLADPAKMGTQTFGAGPYVLDSAQSASGSHYTYTPNPNYWDRTKIHWKKVVVRIVPNENSALQSVKTGQADAMTIQANLVGSAKSGGLSVVNAPVAFMGVNLVDRRGEVAAPLKDVRVRQALNHAVDRAAISKAIFQQYGAPTTQISIPGLDGYVADYDGKYPYDPAKAKKLLADAGYPNGFPLKMETQSLAGINLVTQAVLQQWKKIGVTANVTTDSTIGQWLANATSKKFPALGFAYGGLTTYLLSLDWMLPHATHFNPFASEDPKLSGMLARAAGAEPDQQPKLYQDVMRHVVDQAWFVSVLRFDAIYAYNAKKITGFEVGERYALPDAAWLVKPA